MSDSQNREADAGPPGDVTANGGHGHRPKWFSNKKVKWAAIVLVVWFVLAAVGPCTITHKFGPYYGKTVDAETGEPIEGAVVLAAFYTSLYTPAGYISKFVDAIETVTNANGEFNIPAHRAWVFRTPHGWDPNADCVIFKPGYGNFPGHKDVRPKFTPAFSLPQNEYVVMSLPRIKTRDEANANLRDLPTINLPRDKMPKLLKMIENERTIGLTFFK